MQKNANGDKPGILKLRADFGITLLAIKQQELNNPDANTKFHKGDIAYFRDTR
jgi:K+/H+ antiporter YhaU regulatory subunit KhtT